MRFDVTAECASNAYEINIQFHPKSTIQKHSNSAEKILAMLVQAICMLIIYTWFWEIKWCKTAICLLSYRSK